MNGVEDSLHLLYKRFHDTEWQEYPYYTVNNMGSPTSGSGRFDLSKVLPGTYTWAFHTGQVSVSELASSSVRFDNEYWWSDAAIEQVSLMSLDGKRLAQWDLVQASQKVMLPEGQGFLFCSILNRVLVIQQGFLHSCSLNDELENLFGS